MATINQPNLILFEQVRRELNYIPPANSNEVFKIDDGTIVLQTIDDDSNTYSFNLRIQNRVINVGNGIFYISRDMVDRSKRYKYIYINNKATLSINNTIEISNPNNIDPVAISVDGILNLDNNSNLNMRDNSVININKTGTINIGKDIHFNLGENAIINIYGNITIPYSEVNTVMNMAQINMFNDTIVNITGLPTGRPFSLTDYISDLRNEYQNINTIGTKLISGSARATYYWKAGDPSQPSDVLSFVVEAGDAILGDFNLSCVGMPQITEPYLQVISDITINRIATLHISDSFNGSTYITPTLHLTKIVGNSESVGFCDVDGNIIVSGNKSSIKLDRGAWLNIKRGGNVFLKNGAFIENIYNDEESLFINGTLTIDDISQLRGFTSSNILFGDDGKLIILNTNDSDIKKILFTTPLGIHSSDLYFLFKDRIDKIRYHVPSNTGISLDKYDTGYNLSDLYGGMRLEKAVKIGYIIWHEGAFIELDSSVIPWVDDDPTLEKVGNIFNVYGDTDADRLQNAVIRLIYAGFESIVFRFITGNGVKEITLTLTGSRIKSAFFNNDSNRYLIATDNPGSVFIRNNINSASIDNIINTASKVINISNPDKTEFLL